MDVGAPCWRRTPRGPNINPPSSGPQQVPPPPSSPPGGSTCRPSSVAGLAVTQKAAVARFGGDARLEPPNGHRIGGSCSTPRGLFSPPRPAAAPFRPDPQQDEVRLRRRAHGEPPLRPGGPGERQRLLRRPPRRARGGCGGGGGGVSNRGGHPKEAKERLRRRGRRRRRRRRGASVRREQAEAGGERAGAGPHAQRQHGLHGAAHAHPHRARRQEALQDRDAAAGLQLHLPPGQRAAAGGGLPGRTAVPALPGRPARRRGAERAPAAAHLHVLPEQPKETAQRRREVLSSRLKWTRAPPHPSPSHPPFCLHTGLCKYTSYS